MKKRLFSIVLTLCLLVGSICICAFASVSADNVPTATIRGAILHETTGLRVSELLEVYTEGFKPNADLRYSYQITSSTGSYAAMDLFNGPNMYTAKEYSTYVETDEGSVKPSNAGYKYFALMDKNYSTQCKEQDKCTVTVVVTDKNSDDKATATYTGFLPSDLKKDVQDCVVILFVNESKKMTDVYGYNGVTHITCTYSYTENGRVAPTDIASYSSGSIKGLKSGVATLTIDVGKTKDCCHHSVVNGKRVGVKVTDVQNTVYVVNNPVVAGNGTATFNDVPVGVSITVNGTTLTSTTENQNLVFSGLSQNTNYPVIASVTNNNTNVTTTADTKFTTPKVYNVTVNTTPAGSGTATADATTHAKGESVVVTPAPADNYKVKSVTYKYGTSSTGNLSKQDDGTYKMTMPEKDVTITVTFELHTCSWVYELDKVTTNNDTIKASCTDPVHVGDPQKLTIVPPTALVYDGQSKTATLSTTTVGGVTLSESNIVYYKKNAAGGWDKLSGTAKPIDVGEYKAEITANNVALKTGGKGNLSAYTTFEITPKQHNDNYPTGGNFKADIGTIAAQTYTGSEIEPTEIVIKDGEKVLQLGKDYKFTDYDDNINVTTDDKKAVANIEFIGNYKGTADVPFDILPLNVPDDQKKDEKDQRIKITPPEAKTYTGEKINATDVVIKDGKTTLEAGKDYDVTSWKNNINATTNESKAIAVVTFKGNYTGVQDVPFDILPLNVPDDQKKDEKDQRIKITPPEAKTYTGEKINATDVVIKDNGKTLEAGKDYDVTSWKNNINVTTNESKAIAVVTFKGNYTGTADVPFDILPLNVPDDQKKDEKDQRIKITPPAAKTYTGEKINATDVVIKDNGKTLEAGKDYDVTSWKNNINVTTKDSKAIAVVTFKGNYTGVQDVPFDILPLNVPDDQKKDEKDQRIKITPPAAKIYTGAEIEAKDVVIKDNGKTLEAGKDYDVTSWKNNINITTKDSKAIAVVTFRGNYTGTADVPFDILPLNVNDDQKKDEGDRRISATNPADKIYTGEEIKPTDFVIKDGNKELKPGVDFDCTFENNINVTTPDSKAVIKVTFKGNYQGTMDIEFNILPKDVDKDKESKEPDVSVDNIADQYCNKPIKSEPKSPVKDGEKVLKENVDYTISYRNNEDIGKATAIFNFIGNYKGTIEKDFNIIHKDVVAQEMKNPEINIPGWKPYYYCESCDEYFEDAECTKKIENIEEWKLNEGYLPPLAPPTGDNSNPFAWIATMLVALLGVAVTVFARKKRTFSEQ